MVEGDENGLSHVWFPADKKSLTHKGVPVLVENAAAQLEEYFAGERIFFETDLHVPWASWPRIATSRPPWVDRPR